MEAWRLSSVTFRPSSNDAPSCASSSCATTGPNRAAAECTTSRSICADPERTIRFYQDVLGFPLVELFENRDYEGSSHFFFDIGAGNMLAFFDFPGLGLVPVPEGLGGVQHVAISVTPETFERLKGKLEAAGVEYMGPDRGIKESVYFKDPDGIQIELIRQPLMEVPESAPQED